MGAQLWTWFDDNLPDTIKKHHDFGRMRRVNGTIVTTIYSRVPPYVEVSTLTLPADENAALAMLCVML